MAGNHEGLYLEKSGQQSTWMGGKDRHPKRPAQGGFLRKMEISNPARANKRGERTGGRMLGERGEENDEEGKSFLSEGC